MCTPVRRYCLYAVTSKRNAVLRQQQEHLGTDCYFASKGRAVQRV
jgi:hypothetical protein